jgi:electron transport complex protein RnfG
MSDVKKQASIPKLGITLAAFATAACVVLAFVYAGTEQIIAQRQQTDLEAALKDLFPRADKFVDITGKIESPNPSVTFEGIYEARQGADLVGAALRVSCGSYGGPLKALVGVNAGGTIAGVRILEHQDTPGLGANAVSPSFTGQFDGKSVRDPFEANGDVKALTAATITSRAVAGAVKAAGTAAAAYLGGTR